MVRVIQQLTASLGLVCVAEWICNENVAELLKALGVEY
jgi:EAL domain-containing protein (putative c-di-GMP-specific phosphodiesterase class I)